MLRTILLYRISPPPLPRSLQLLPFPDLRMRRNTFPRALNHIAIGRGPGPGVVAEEAGAGRLDKFVSQSYILHKSF